MKNTEFGAGVKEIMTFDLLAGTVLVIIALACVLLLTLWSRSTIERIHSEKPSSLRQFKQDSNNGRK